MEDRFAVTSLVARIAIALLLAIGGIALVTIALEDSEAECGGG